MTNVLGNRRDVLLGNLGAAASRAEYSRVITQWEAQEAPEILIAAERAATRPAPNWKDVPDGMAALFHEGCKQQPGHSFDMMGDFAKQFVWTAAMLQAVLGRAVPLLHISLESVGRGSPTPPHASTVRPALEEFARGEKCW